MNITSIGTTNEGLIVVMNNIVGPVSSAITTVLGKLSSVMVLGIRGHTVTLLETIKDLVLLARCAILMQEWFTA